jgi:hypothetical protein
MTGRAGEPMPMVRAGETSAGANPRRRGWAVLGGLSIVYAALFVAFYPPSLGIEDEVGYFNQALVWSRGSLTAGGAGFHNLMGFLEIGGREVAVRQPGRSLAILPFLLAAGPRAAFLSGLLVHLATVAAGGALLVRLGRSPAWAVLLLCHPTLAIYSRTLMADEGAGLGLLLAALAVATTTRPFMGAWAGAAVVLGALMRYHAGLALPFVAASFLVLPARPRPLREAGLCLLTGGLGGGLIVAYNLFLYHHPTDPSPTARGVWSSQFIVPQAVFYATALTTFWPGMLLAPILDRSVVRWTVRGVCGFFLAMFLFYYWHDAGSGWIETAVLGLRLILVALPLWIVSYAGVVDDLVVAPLRRRLGPAPIRRLSALACVGLLAATGAMCARHQAHLRNLETVRAAVAAAVPDSARVAANSTVMKLFGVPTRPPSYRWLYLPDVAADRCLPADLGASPWYVAVAIKSPDNPATAEAHAAAARFGLTPLATDVPGLTLYASRPASRTGP